MGTVAILTAFLAGIIVAFGQFGYLFNYRATITGLATLYAIIAVVGVVVSWVNARRVRITALASPVAYAAPFLGLASYLSDTNDPTTRHFWFALWTPAIVAAAASVLGGILGAASSAARGEKRRRQGMCAECGYDLRSHHAGERCPECGSVITTSAR